MSIMARHPIAARLRILLNRKVASGRLAVRVGVEAVGNPQNFEFSCQKIFGFQGSIVQKRLFLQPR